MLMLTELPENWMEQLLAAHAPRSGGNGKGALPRLMAACIASGATWERILLGVQKYHEHCRKTGIVGTGFVMQLRTFIGRDMHFDEYADMDLRTPAQIATDTKWQQLEQRATALGYTTLDRGRGLSTMESVIRDLENAKGRELVRGLRIVKTVGGA